MARDYGASSDAYVPLLAPQNGSVFVPSSARRRKDNAWTLAWATTYTACVVLGIFAFFHRNTSMLEEQTSPSYLSDPSHCPLEPPSADRRSLFSFRDEDSPFQLDQFLKHAVFWLVGSVIGALLVGLLFVWLVAKKPYLLVGLAIGVQILLPLLGGTSAILSSPEGYVSAQGIFLLIFAALVAFVFWLWRSQLALVTSLLGISGHGLRENTALIPAVIGVQGGLLVLTFPLILSLFAAIANGGVVFNPQRNPELPATCVDSDGNDIVCCVWETAPFVGPYLAYALLILMWTCFIGGEVRTFIVSGTIAQWYFSPPAPTDEGQASKAKQPRTSRVFESVSSALGTSFGSLCFGGAVLTLVSLLRSLLDQLRKNGDRNIFVYCFWLLCQYVFTLIELVTKFATVRLAITGESFMEGGKGVTDMLSRNFLNTFGVWWFPPMILQMASVVISFIWATVIYAVSSNAWSKLHQGHEYAASLAIIAFLLTWAVVSFFASLILNVIESVYICFALDRDLQAVTRAEVHAVYHQLPSVQGALVQNPDGSIAYAQP